MEELKFPEGFKWGSATSAYQIEGGNHNDWSSQCRNCLSLNPSRRPRIPCAGKACDSYNRYEEDFDIAKKLNQNIHRFSIEWSRIEPKEGRFDPEAMHHYVNVVKALRERGIEPMVTLWHFTNPVWFAEKSGWLNEKSPEYFTRYAKYVVDNLKDKVGLWITFNEASDVYAAMSYYRGVWPPNKKNIFSAIKVVLNIIKAHTLAYQEIKKIYNVPSPVLDLNGSVSHNMEPLVGIVENNRHFIAGNFLRRLRQRVWEYYRNRYLLDRVQSSIDFIGLNYYTIDRLFGSYSVLPKQPTMEEMGWEIYPKGIYHELMALKSYKKPIFITENGIADSKDEKREKFIKDHLRWVWQAIHDGADVRGYMYWSLLDNFEWAHGFGPKFGLVEVNYETFARKIRPSALEYAKICKTNQLEIDS
ncbi:MAG: glycoside hydrolase family 1 protein [Patescibacteria group bacterium]